MQPWSFHGCFLSNQFAKKYSKHKHLNIFSIKCCVVSKKTFFNSYSFFFAFHWMIAEYFLAFAQKYLIKTYFLFSFFMAGKLFFLFCYISSFLIARRMFFSFLCQYFFYIVSGVSIMYSRYLQRLGKVQNIHIIRCVTYVYLLW